MDQFWVIRDGAQSGPFSEAEVLRAYHDGTLLPTDTLWAEGIDAPVSVAEAFAHLQAGASSDALSLEPIDPAVAARLPADAVRRSERDERSPYRAPAAALDPPAGIAGAPAYAGFWVRYGASTLDALILGAISAVIALAAVALAASLGIDLTDSPAANFAISFVLTWLYLALGESSDARATWGKRAFHLQVVQAENLERISFWRASGRFLGRYLSIFLLMLGYLMQPFNERKRALHDFLAGTVVLVEREYSRLLLGAMVVLGLALPVMLVAAVALPVYQSYVVRQQVATALRQVTPATSAVQRYLRQTGQVPPSLEDAGFDSRARHAGVRQIAFAADSGIITVTLEAAPVAGSTVLILPAAIENGQIAWRCRAGTLRPGLLPRECPPAARGE